MMSEIFRVEFREISLTEAHSSAHLVLRDITKPLQHLLLFRSFLLKLPNLSLLLPGSFSSSRRALRILDLIAITSLGKSFASSGCSSA
jgi:hypothetical protein